MDGLQTIKRSPHFDEREFEADIQALFTARALEPVLGLILAELLVAAKTKKAADAAEVNAKFLRKHARHLMHNKAVKIGPFYDIEGPNPSCDVEVSCGGLRVRFIGRVDHDGNACLVHSSHDGMIAEGRKDRRVPMELPPAVANDRRVPAESHPADAAE